MLPAKRLSRVPLFCAAAALVAVLEVWLLSAVLAPKSTPAALPSPAAPANLPLGPPATNPVAENQPTGVPATTPPTTPEAIGQPAAGRTTTGRPAAGRTTHGRPVVGTPSTRPTSATGPATPTPTAEQPSPTTNAPTTTPAPDSAVTATLTVTSSWDDGYVAVLTVHNSGSTTVPWTGTVGNARRLHVRLGNAWNATASQDGSTIVLRGEPLAPGRTITAGYQVSAAADSYPHPSACTLTGSTCRFA